MAPELVSTKAKTASALFSIQTVIERLIFVFSTTLISVTPLISFRAVNEIFEFPKMTFVYVLGSAILILEVVRFLLSFLCNGKKTGTLNFVISKTDILVVLFLLANALSTLHSEYKYTSIWGYYTRFNGGLISTFIYTFLYFSFKHTFKEKWKAAIKTVVFLSVPICVYAVLQNLGFEKNFWKEDSQARVFSTLGQPNWLAAYILLILFPALRFYLEKKGRERVVFGLIVVLCFSSFWFTYSLSGLLGLGFGVLLFCALYGAKRLKAESKYLLIISAACLFVMILRPGVIGPKLRDAVGDVKRTLTLAHTAFASETTDTTQVDPVQSSTQITPDKQSTKKNPFGDTTQIRLIVWKGALMLIKSSPKNFVFGTGPETFAYSFLKYRPAELNNTTEWDFVFNKPHNFYLEIASNLGFLGLAVFTVLYGGFLKKLVTDDRDFGTAPGILGLFISDAFGWHTVAISLFLYFLLAVLHTPRPEEKNYTLSVLRLPAALMFVIAGVVSSLILKTSINFFRADYLNTKSKSYLYDSQINKAADASQKAVRLNPNEPAYYRNKAVIYITASSGENVSKEDSNLLRQFALAGLNAAHDKQPFNLVNIKSLIPLYYYASIGNLLADNPKPQEEFTKKAMEVYEGAEKLSPNDASLMLILGKYYRLFGEYNKAAIFLNRALELKPDLTGAKEELDKLLEVKELSEKAVKL